MAMRTTHRKATTRTSRASRGRRPAATGRHQASIQRFLDGLADALTSGDGDAAAACFEYPALMVMARTGAYGGNQVIADRDTAAGFFGSAPEQYHAKGIHLTFPDIQSLEWLGDDLALVRVRFPYIDADGNDMGDAETSVYVVRKTGPDLAICTAITLGVDSERGGRTVSARP
jgi:hypothetical protein